MLTKQGLSVQVRARRLPVTKLVVQDSGDQDAERGKLLAKRQGSRFRGAQDDRAIRGPADKTKMNYGMTLLILFILLIYVTMVYGPIAALLVELFPTRIRYTSMCLPYHIGNGWFGGMLPTAATAMVAATGDIYYGLWYPIIVAVDARFVIGTLFLRETKDRDIYAGLTCVAQSRKPAERRVFLCIHNMRNPNTKGRGYM